MFTFPVNSAEKNTPIVDLKELLRIEDNGIDFYFKYPRAPVIDKRGAMYIVDDKQLLKFDKDGKFIGNYLKEGLGPGEANYPREVLIQGDYFILYNIHPSKFLWFDQTDGTLKRETRLSDKLGYSNFLTYYNNKYFFFREAFRHTRNGKYIDTFLLKMPEKMVLCRINISQTALYKDYLFIFEQNDDGDFELAKYRLINIPGWAK